MKRTLLFSRCLLFLLVTSFITFFYSPQGLLQAEEPAGLLDGKSYVGKTGEVGKDATEDEEVVFKDGKFHSVSCEPWGFNDGEYKAMRSGEGDTIHFEAETESPKHGKIVWKGTAQGEKIDVKYTWTKKGFLGTKSKDKWFKGSLKQ